MFENSRWIVDMNPLCTHVTAKSKIQEFATGPTCHVFDVSKCHTAADATQLVLLPDRKSNSILYFSGLWTLIEAQLDCAPSAMSKCTDPLKVVTDNKDLGFATSKEELVKMCP